MVKRLIGLVANCLAILIVICGLASAFDVNYDAYTPFGQGIRNGHNISVATVQAIGQVFNISQTNISFGNIVNVSARIIRTGSAESGYTMRAAVYNSVAGVPTGNPLGFTDIDASTFVATTCTVANKTTWPITLSTSLSGNNSYVLVITYNGTTTAAMQGCYNTTGTYTSGIGRWKAQAGSWADMGATSDMDFGFSINDILQISGPNSFRPQYNPVMDISTKLRQVRTNRQVQFNWTCPEAYNPSMRYILYQEADPFTFGTPVANLTTGNYLTNMTNNGTFYFTPGCAYDGIENHSTMSAYKVIYDTNYERVSYVAFSDDFERADNTTLGNNWYIISSTNGVIRINNNKVNFSSTSGSSNLQLDNRFDSTDFILYASVDITRLTSNQNYVAVTLLGGGSTFAQCIFQNTRLECLANGTTFVAATPNITLGLTYTILFKNVNTVDNTYEIWINGVKTLTLPGAAAVKYLDRIYFSEGSSSAHVNTIDNVNVLIPNIGGDDYIYEDLARNTLFYYDFDRIESQSNITETFQNPYTTSTSATGSHGVSVNFSGNGTVTQICRQPGSGANQIHVYEVINTTNSIELANVTGLNSTLHCGSFNLSVTSNKSYAILSDLNGGSGSHTYYYIGGLTQWGSNSNPYIGGMFMSAGYYKPFGSAIITNTNFYDITNISFNLNGLVTNQIIYDTVTNFSSQLGDNAYITNNSGKMAGAIFNITNSTATTVGNNIISTGFVTNVTHNLKNFGFCGWIYPTEPGCDVVTASTSCNYAIVSNWNGVTNPGTGHQILLGAGNKIKMHVCNNGLCASLLSSTTSVTLNNWSHICVSSDEYGTVSFYINGVFDTWSTVAQVGDYGNAWAIGRGPGANVPRMAMSGFFDEFLYLNRSLRKDFINYIYNSGSPDVRAQYPYLARPANPIIFNPVNNNTMSAFQNTIQWQCSPGNQNTLYFDNNSNPTTIVINNQTSISSYITNVSIEQPYYLKVQCSIAGFYAYSPVYKWVYNNTLPPNATKFDGNTTNFSTVNDLRNVPNLILENTSYGKIEWNVVTNVDKLDLDNNVFFEYNKVGLNAVNLTSLNSSANITINFNETPYIRVLRDGIECPTNVCTNIRYNGQRAKFMVTGFSNYSLNGTNTTNTNLSDCVIINYANFNYTVIQSENITSGFCYQIYADDVNIDGASYNTSVAVRYGTGAIISSVNLTRVPEVNVSGVQWINNYALYAVQNYTLSGAFNPVENGVNNITSISILYASQGQVKLFKPGNIFYKDVSCHNVSTTLYCLVNMSFYEPADNYDVVFNDTFATRQIGNFTYNVLLALRNLNAYTSLPFLPGQANISSDPVVIRNTGNANLATVYVLAYDLSGINNPIIKLYASYFYSGKTIGSSVQLVNNASTPVVFSLLAGQSQQDNLYLYVNTPQSIYIQPYVTTTPWSITVS
jgi:hypothetical protein